MNNSKTRCPKCRTVYSINEHQINIIGKKAAKCIICDARFLVEARVSLEKEETHGSAITFLQSYFEKRGGIVRRKSVNRRKDIEMGDLSLKSFPNDIIPIFSNDNNEIIGHISPGRRQGEERRRGLERRQSAMNQS
jgi:predicted Zn finger-like uncharacterized protein